MNKLLVFNRVEKLHLVLQDLLQLTRRKLRDQQPSEPGEIHLKAAAWTIKLGEVVSDVDEQQDLIERLQDARHDGVYVAVVQVKKESQSGKSIITYKAALNRADFLELLKPLCDV